MNTDKLDLLALGQNFTVTKLEDGEYRVDSKKSNLAAFIAHDQLITYYLSDCYNSGFDILQINLEELDKLRKFCSLLTERNERSDKTFFELF